MPDLEKQFNDTWPAVKDALPDTLNASVIANICAAIILMYAPTRQDASESIAATALALAAQTFNDELPRH